MKTLKEYLNETLKTYEFYDEMMKNKNLYNIIVAAETLNYYLNFYNPQEEQTEDLFDIVADITANDYPEEVLL